MSAPTRPAEVADGVFRLAGSSTNCYLVADGADVTLVDAGYPSDTGAVIGALEQLDRSPADVAAVVLTHGHVDHIGAAETLRSEHGARVLSHHQEAPNVRGVREERISELDVALRLWQPKMASFVLHFLRSGALAVDHVEEVATFNDETPLDVPGTPVPVFTPGHTSGHCAFHLPDRGVLITGDALVTYDPITRRTGPRLLNRLFNRDHDRALASLEALEPLEAEVVLPGHGEPLRSAPEQAVDEARRQV